MPSKLLKATKFINVLSKWKHVQMELVVKMIVIIEEP